MDDATRQYLEVLFAGLKSDIDGFRRELSILSGELGKQGASIHAIELTVTQKMTKLEGDVNNAFGKIRDLEKSLMEEETNRIQSDISLGTRLTTFENLQAEKWKKYVEDQKAQAIENDRNGTARKVLAGVATLVLTSVFYLLWDIIFTGKIP
jgi:uncharacterized protein YqgV (UPF0045/DUF77 family)